VEQGCVALVVNRKAHVMTRLSTLTDFAAEGSVAARYTPLPPDWWLAVADVVGSTRLAAEGRHRDVNFVAGAAVSVLSALIEAGGERPCCQFGGDGALAAIPPALRDQAEEALCALVDWSVHELDVPIRAGLVQVAELTAQGLEVRAALQDLGGGNCFGLFMGAGVAAAEEWVKGDPARQVIPAPGPLPGLEALSCRWTPVPASRGVVLCVIVDPTAAGPAGDAVLARLQNDIEAVVATETATPLSPGGERLVPRWPPSLRSLWLESRTVPPGKRVVRVLRAVVQSALVKLIHASGRKLFGFDGQAYAKSLAERSDYRKAAGGPRFVLDVTENEARAIEALLERYVTAGEIRYGSSRAASTTITCRVGDFAADRHVHFVDGAELGFWRAATALKQRFLRRKAG
jgi:hypothetical protein